MSTLADACLLAADTLRENPERWTHEVYFRDAQGRASAFDDGPALACSACAVGMVLIAADVLGVEIDVNDMEMRLGVAIRSDDCAYDLTDFNDDIATGPDDVADKLEKIAAVL